MRLCGDLEADGLLVPTPESPRTLTRIWCAVFEDIDTGEEIILDDSDIDMLPDVLGAAELVIMHNLMQYDRLAIQKVYGYLIPRAKCWDTLVWSNLLHPDRKVPKGFKGKDGPHSIAAWGHRFGIPKPKHDEWDRYSDEMLHRCIVDKDLNVKVYHELLKEKENGH